MPRFETSTTLACPQETVFDFLSRPANAVETSPPDMHLTLLEAPEVIAAGSRISFEVRAYGHRQNFLHEITELDAPRRFVERQVEGPFKHFVHEHLFEPQHGTVQVIDRIDFAPPGGLMGFLLTERRIREGLEANFRYRYAVMKRRLERST